MAIFVRFPAAYSTSLPEPLKYSGFLARHEPFSNLSPGFKSVTLVLATKNPPSYLIRIY